MFINMFKRNQKSDCDNEKNYDIAIENLKKEMKDKVEQLNNRVDKQERIARYSEDKPSFKITHTQHDGMFFGICGYIPYVCLYLYINKEEYKIVLKEFRYKDVDENNCKLKVENKLAYFDVMACSIEESTDTIYKFIINYENGEYVMSIEKHKSE